MTDHELPDLLDRLAERHPVGPPPTSAMVATASRARRRRTSVTVLAAAAAVAAVAVVSVQLQRPSAAPLLPGPSDSAPSDVVVPDGHRLVGAGHVGILVPDSWATNALRCGTVVRDSVVVDVGVIETCLWLSPTVHDSVWIEERVELDDGGEPVAIGGLEARRYATRCETDVIDNLNPSSTITSCAGAMKVPEETVTFVARSATAEGVDAILDRIVALGPDQVAVPGTSQILYGRDTQEHSGQLYVERLHALGLQAEVVQQSRPGIEPGFILDVTPGPGAVLDRGATVTVTVVAPPNGPAEEISVGMTTLHGQSEYGEVTDSEIRAGATVHLRVGDGIWAYSKAEKGPQLVAEIRGTSLVDNSQPGGPNQGRTWMAVESGATEITLSVVVDGRSYEIGTVRVIVD